MNDSVSSATADADDPNPPTVRIAIVFEVPAETRGLDFIDDARKEWFLGDGPCRIVSIGMALPKEEADSPEDDRCWLDAEDGL